MRATTYVVANFRAATRARSKAEFYAKLSIAVEEADEAAFWLELLEGAGIISMDGLKSLQDEAIQILKILSSTRKRNR